MLTKNVLDYCEELNKLGIENHILEHPPLRTTVDILKHLGLTFADCAPTLIMKGDNKYIVVVIRGDTRADFKKIKLLLNVSDLRMATPDEFTVLTGLPIGAARVLIPNAEKTVIDVKVFEKEYLAGGSGDFSYSINYKTEDLKVIPNSIIADIAKDSEKIK